MLLTTLSSCIHTLVMVFYLHPIHVSVTEIEFDEKEKSLEIMMRVFADDLEDTMRKHMNQPGLDIISPSNGMTVDQMVSGYLSQHFKVSLDGKAQKTSYLGHEREADTFIFYIEVTNVKKWKTIQIQNDILTEVFDDQSNLVHVTVKDEVKSLRLTRDTPADKITF
jgi:hypothetical protein